MAKKTRPRSERRERERALSKLQNAREQLFRLELGGSAQRPLLVVSSAVVEAHAESVPCPRCDGKQGVLEHVAVTVSGARVREVRLRCRQCASERSMWFRIRPAGPDGAGAPN
jgi:hypothetical protein